MYNLIAKSAGSKKASTGATRYVYTLFGSDEAIAHFIACTKAGTNKGGFITDQGAVLYFSSICLPLGMSYCPMFYKDGSFGLDTIELRGIAERAREWGQQDLVGEEYKRLNKEYALEAMKLKEAKINTAPVEKELDDDDKAPF